MIRVSYEALPEAFFDMPPYERLKAWQRSHQLVLEIYRVTQGWPSDEKYGLIAQLRRAGFSIPANIAEGTSKRGKREWRRFLDVAIGSMGEVCYGLRVARDLGYLKPTDWERIEAVRDEAGRLLWGLYRSLRPDQ